MGMNLAGIRSAVVAWVGLGMLVQAGAQEPLAQQSAPGAPTAPTTPRGEGRIFVKKLHLEGMGAMLSATEVRSVLQKYEGRDLALAELQEVTRELTSLLKERGYFLARVLLPVQEVQDGQVRLELLAGSVGKIVVEGNQHYSSDFIREHVESALSADGLVTEEELQSKLLILNDNSDLFVTALFQPGSQKGETDLTLAVDDSEPVHGGIGYDNLGTQFTNIHRLSPHVTLGNLLQDGDSLSTRYFWGLPDNRANFLQTTYTTPIDRDGTRLSFGYANGASTLGQDLQVLDIRGRASIYSLQVSHPLQRTVTQRQDLSLSYAYKQFDNSLLGLSTGQDRYHALRLAYAGDFSDLDGRTLVNAALTQGLGGSTLNNGLGRLGVNPAFSKINLDLARIQHLEPSLFLILRAGGQWAPNPIFAAEQFALGGVDSVRGYNQAQFLGDVGYSMSAEARWLPFEDRRDVQFAAFLDHGGARVLQPQPGQLDSQSLTGAGLGVRFNLGSAAQLRLDVGWPLSPSTNFSGDRPVFYGQVFTNF